jgi:hypothetical protein
MVGEVETKEEATKLPFVALYRVIKAGLTVLETSVSQEKSLGLKEEFDQFKTGDLRGFEEHLEAKLM